MVTGNVVVPMDCSISTSNMDGMGGIPERTYGSFVPKAPQSTADTPAPMAGEAVFNN